MEAAGLGLGVIALFPACVQSYQVLSTMEMFPRDSLLLFWSLKAQEPPPVLATVHGILGSIKAILTDGQRLTSRYGLRSHDSPPPPAAAIRVNSFGRLRWAIRDKNAFEGLVTDLRHLNDDLEAVLTLPNRQLLAIMLATRMVSETEHMTDLHALQTLPRNSQLLQAMASFKCLNVQLESSNTSNSAFDAPQEIALDQITWVETHDSLALVDTSRQLGVFSPHDGNHNMLVEWRYYTEASGSGFGADSALERVRRLACLLGWSRKPEHFRVLDCLGYTHDRFRSRIGLLLAKPKLSTASQPFSWSWPQKTDSVAKRNAASPEWISLNQLITYRSKLPVLGHRYALALSLTRSMVEFHATGWLHKNFRSANVLFFENSHSHGSPIFANIHEPWIVGFGFARPQSNVEISDETGCSGCFDDLYVHPHYLDGPRAAGHCEGPRYSPDYDMHALGCVLLEIGLWKRLSDLWKDEYKDRGWNYWTEKLLAKWVPELGGRCGLVYEDIVRDLLARAAHVGDRGGLQHPMTNFEILSKLEGLKV